MKRRPLWPWEQRALDRHRQAAEWTLTEIREWGAAMFRHDTQSFTSGPIVVVNKR